jgi:methionyl-tRNA formyltransferase
VRAIVDRIRAFDPVPGSSAEIERLPGTTLKVWAAAPDPRPTGGTAPGTVLSIADGAIVAAAGDGALALLELQRPGGRRLTAREFLAGFPVRVGDRLREPAE